MDLFNLVAKLGLDTSEYSGKMAAAMREATNAEKVTEQLVENVGEIGKAYEDAADDVEEAVEQMADAVDDATDSTEEHAEKTGEAGKKVKKHWGQMGESAEKAGGKIKASTIAIGQALYDMVKATANAAAGLVKTGITYNRQMEDYTTNFKVMLGGVEAAQAKVEELKKMAAKTPFEMSDLADATQTLLAFGVANGKTTDVMTKLGDISLGNAQRFASLSNAYGKAAAQGKLTGEVVQMMVDAGFNPLLQIVDATGESMEDLQKRMSAGKVSVDELDLALRRATGEGGQFYKGMEEASKTMSGQLSTLADNWNALLGKAMEPANEQLSTKILPKAIESLDKLSAALFGVEEDANGAKKALFLNAGGEAIDPGTNLLTWVQDLMTEWTNGKTEDAETVQSFVASFNENSNAIKDALIARIDDMSNPMTPEEMEEAKAKIAEITAMQGEVEALLQKRAGGYITEDEEARLNTIIATLQAMQTEIEGAAGFDENIVTPWERMMDAAGTLAVDAIDKIAGFLEWCASDGENAKNAVDGITIGLSALVGMKLGFLVGGPVGGLLGFLGGAGGAAVVRNLEKIENAALDAIKALMGLTGTETEVTKGITMDVLKSAYKSKGPTISSADGSHADGLDYVPFDNYRAILHEGEAVLTKSEARAWRGGDAPTQIDYGRMASAFVSALAAAGLGFNVDGRTLAVATAGNNVRAANARANDINIGRVR